MSRSRTFDLVLWGATGFTGRLVATELGAVAKSLRWALAGRDQGKLEALRQELMARHPGLREPPLLVADSSDQAALDRLAASTRVVCTTVGPYARYGDALVAACVAHGTHTCDLTGEPQWVRRMIDAHDARARETGARIVHCCGFDSIPSDLGVFLLQEGALERHGAPCSEVTASFGPLRGSVSGGSLHSMLTLVEELGRDRAARRVMRDPYALYPAGIPAGRDGLPSLRVRRAPGRDGWTGPFVMAVINERVVRRTNALLGFPYGTAFRYREVAAYPAGRRGLAMALGTGAAMASVGVAGRVWGLPRLLGWLAPRRPGEGPDAEALAQGFFRVCLEGRGKDPGGRPFEMSLQVEGGEPGYAETSRMLVQAALCLAQDDLSSPGGVHTPASAMARPLLARLRRGPMVWQPG
jgi:short subunit dehydrogenase-like uncharacterized protein